MGLCFDESGRPIDFSSRPIDPIFRKAREHLDHQRDYTRLAEPVNAMSHASSDSSVHDGSGATIGGDLGLLSRTSGCLIGISADRLKSLSSAATASSIAGGMTFNSMTAVSSHNEQHDRPESNNNPMAIKSGANSASCSNVASPSNPLAVGIAKPSPKPMSKPAKRKFGQEDSNQVIVDLQDDNDKNLNVEELSPPASNKARSNTISATTSTMSGFSGLTSSALLSAALQKQQNLAASQGVNSSNDYENLDVVVTEACNDESGLVEVVDSGKVARSIESGELLDEDHSKNEGNSRQTTEKSTSSPTNDQPLTVDDMDDGEDSSPGGKRLRIASFSSVDDGDV
uniref:Uncharacterized protein n=1 Tax=Ditylenchus dipsaci TaxID=166011 RepID=A0A915CZD1_9BILA